MKIALIGYGKMGQAIEKIAIEKGYEIVLKISKDNADELTAEALQKADVAIEFTGPESAVENVKQCIAAGVPVVCGSTGWLARWEEVRTYCLQHQGSLVYASNYSIGVNIFFELNRRLAELMSAHPSYDVMLEEIHHTQKKDAPSGTAITLAEQILEKIKTKDNWVNEAATSSTALQIISKRIDPAPGTHKVKYTSAVDDIEIIHTAHSRTGFASGALAAAEFVQGKTGIFNMKDVLGL